MQFPLNLQMTEREINRYNVSKKAKQKAEI